MDALKSVYAVCILGIQYITSAGSLTVENNSVAVIQCNVANFTDYPSWSGPPMTQEGVRTPYSIQPNPTFNPNLGANKRRRLSWADNKKDLIFSTVIRSDMGNYLCISVPGGIANVTLAVRVPPALPIIYNTATGSQNELTVSGTEGTPLTLTCISAGGYPQQTVNWYLESVNSKPVLADSPIVVSGDLYNVTRSYTFTPTSSDDGVTYICQSLYNDEPQLFRRTDVKLFLMLQPSIPTVAVLGNPVESSTSINIAVCTSFGFRPQTVSLSWTLDGGTKEPVSNPTVERNTTTNTFSVSDMYSRAVGRADNRKKLMCSINHTTLSSPKTAFVTLNVQFPALFTTISGNSSTVANGVNKVTFTCTTGSSNPASGVTWYQDGQHVSSDRLVQEIDGQYAGKITSQVFEFTPTRDMDGHIIKCRAGNGLSGSSYVEDQVALNLTYTPITIVHCPSTATEGSNAPLTLSCTAISKPSSSFTWAHGSFPISTSQGPVAKNEFNHVIFSVNRSHYGRYKCTADNNISPANERSCNIEVKFPALFTNISGNPSIVANGVNKVTLTCTTGSSNPASNITWYRDGQHVTSDKLVQQTGGQYGGKVTSQVFEFTPTRDMDSHVIKCTAGNGLSGSSYVEDEVALDLTYSPVVTAISRIENETQPGLLQCLVSSKPAARIKWYRVDNRNKLLVEGTDINSLEYPIGTVSRDDAGTYKCTANNGIEGDISHTVDLVVMYKPDVTVITHNTTKNNQSELQCQPRGVPSSYTYISWKQTWPGSSDVLRSFPGSANLSLSDLRYEHTGIYTCSVDNGVEYSRNPSAGQGQVFFGAKSRPVVTKAQQTIQKAAQLGEVSTIKVEFVSNSPLTKINVEKRGNNTASQSILFTTTTMSAIISVQVFNKTVKTEGLLSEIYITVVSEDDFGLYDILIENDVGTAKRVVNLVPKGPPSQPGIISITDVTETSALLTWIRGFHGGSDQTVKIEISRDGTSWTLTLSLPQGMLEDTSPVNSTITKLLTSTLYYMRMFSVNADGESPITGLLKFSTKGIILFIEDKPQNYAPVIGGVVGGSLGAVVAVTVLILILRRKYSCSCNMSVSKKEDVHHSGQRNNGADNQDDYNAAVTYEDVSAAKETPVYVALNDGKDGPENPHVYMALGETNPLSLPYNGNVKRGDPIYNNTVLKPPVQAVLYAVK